MVTLATVVEWDALLKTVWASIAAGVGVTFAFSVAIYGAARAAEFRRDDRWLGVGVAFFLMLAGFAVCTAAITYGVVIMTQKS
jgi:hypothetical protein